MPVDVSADEAEDGYRGISLSDRLKVEDNRVGTTDQSLVYRVATYRQGTDREGALDGDHCDLADDLHTGQASAIVLEYDKAFPPCS